MNVSQIMKDKNRLSKIITSAIISAILGALFGSLVTLLTDLAIKQLPIDPIYLVLCVSLLVTILVFMILHRIETIEEFRYDAIKYIANGFINIEQSAISDFAVSLVKKSHYIRVVGTARQDVLDSKIQGSARNYLKSLENMLNKKCISPTDAFTYYRVVPKELKQTFAEHITNCTSKATANSNRFEVKELENNNFFISYQTFDDTDLLIIVDNKAHTGRNDNALCLWTQNKEIVNTFIKRFDDSWNEI